MCQNDKILPCSQLCHTKVNIKGKHKSLERTYIDKTAHRWMRCLGPHIYNDVVYKI